MDGIWRGGTSSGLSGRAGRPLMGSAAPPERPGSGAGGGTECLPVLALMLPQVQLLSAAALTCADCQCPFLVSSPGSMRQLCFGQGVGSQQYCAPTFRQRQRQRRGVVGRCCRCCRRWCCGAFGAPQPAHINVPSSPVLQTRPAGGRNRLLVVGRCSLHLGCCSGAAQKPALVMMRPAHGCCAAKELEDRRGSGMCCHAAHRACRLEALHC